MDQIKAWRGELAAIAPWVAALRACEHLKIPCPATKQARASLGHDPRRAVISAERRGRRRQDRSACSRARPARGIELRTAAVDHELMSAVGRSRSAGLLSRLMRLVDRAEALAAAMDFRPLYRPERHLFAIGFNVAQGRLDSACYDLLTSEACLTSYLAVARGEAPRRHWFQLGRHFIRAAGRLGLISWGGTMFEYVMPRLLLQSLPGTVLDRSRSHRRGPSDRIRQVPRIALGRLRVVLFRAVRPMATTTTRPSVCRALGSSKDWIRTRSSRLMRLRIAAMIAPRAGRRELRPTGPRGSRGNVRPL